MSGDLAIGIVLVCIVLPFLFSALKESGRVRLPRFGRKSSAFRQFPTFPDDGEE